ncbi:HD domain-containing protein [Bradyrhizobium sp. 41S5]|uniref:HD domain-containing protein n=1 Tax=Bradyrhizobium sp. 41S5 TaxID=1404443 RepID=UPI00156AE57C|nr:HD domain-containing protein [Bradyrhizobium sp. 41S5]UFX42016.1 HD domain-containing protein [Bradyrhizobium sp. 41S5]
MTDLIDSAREFAREKHAEQLRNYTREPYFVHLEEVAGIAERAGLSEAAIAAAWLHDVIEDQNVLESELVLLFGQRTAAIVSSLTDMPPTAALNREMRKEIDRQRLAAASPEAQGVKCADLISNTATIVKHNPGFAKKYLPEKRAILEVLTRAPAPLLEQAWASLIEAERQLEATNAVR